MGATYKVVSEETYIECDSFESALAEVAKFADFESIVITKMTSDETTVWTIFTNRAVDEAGERVGATELPIDQSG